jgi:hypothetical protein
MVRSTRAAPEGLRRVRRPWGPDLARIVGVELIFGALFLLLIDLALGWSFVRANWFAWPIALAGVAPIELLLGFPSRTARSVTVDDGGFEIVRLRRPEQFPWSSWAPAPGYRWHILYGPEFLVTLPRASGPGAAVSLTAAQHALLQRWRPAPGPGR